MKTKTKRQGSAERIYRIIVPALVDFVLKNDGVNPKQIASKARKAGWTEVDLLVVGAIQAKVTTVREIEKYLGGLELSKSLSTKMDRKAKTNHRKTLEELGYTTKELMDRGTRSGILRGSRAPEPKARGSAGIEVSSKSERPESEKPKVEPNKALEALTDSLIDLGLLRTQTCVDQACSQRRIPPEPVKVTKTTTGRGIATLFGLPVCAPKEAPVTSFLMSSSTAKRAKYLQIKESRALTHLTLEASKRLLVSAAIEVGLLESIRILTELRQAHQPGRNPNPMRSTPKPDSSATSGDESATE